MKAIALVALLAAALTCNGQSEKTVYYFLDAMTSVKSAAGQAEKSAYIYSFPVTRTTQDELNIDVLIKSFKKEIIEKYGVTDVTSLVVRTNDNFDELRAHMKRSIDKFAGKDYAVIKHENRE